MSQSVDKIIPVELNIKKTAAGSVSFGTALVTFGDAKTDKEKEIVLHTSYDEVLEKYPEKEGILSVAKNWFDTGGNSLITFGYAYSESLPNLTSFDIESDIANPKVGDVINITVNNIKPTDAVADVILTVDNSLLASVSGMTVEALTAGDFVITATDTKTSVTSDLSLTSTASKNTKKTAKTSIEELVVLSQSDVRRSALTAKLSNISRVTEPSSFAEALSYVADKFWFYFPFYTHTTETNFDDAVSWCNSNTRFALFNNIEKSAVDENDTEDLGSHLSALGFRRCAIIHSEINDFTHVRVAGMMSMVDFSQSEGYKDAEYKSINQVGDNLSATDIHILLAKGYFFNTEIASKASMTGAMLQNTMTTSEFGETISEVMAIDSYLINAQSALLNVVTSQRNLPQTVDGQQLAICAMDMIGERYIESGFLGQREIIHPITKESVTTRGYETTTVAEDIYKLTDASRDNHELYPITQYIYKSGSAWTVKAIINVW